VRGNRRHRIALHGEHATLDLDEVILLKQIIGIGYVALQTSVEHPLAHGLLDVVDRIAQLLDHGMSSQRVHVEVVGLGGEDEKGHHRGVRLLVLEHRVQASQCLDEDVGSLVSKLVATGDEEVQGLI